MDLNSFLNYGVDAAIIGVAALLVGPAIYRFIAKRGSRPAPSPSDVAEAGDNRPQLGDALRLIADHVAEVKCPQLRMAGDKAVTDLSQIVIRPVDYSPPKDVAPQPAPAT